MDKKAVSLMISFVILLAIVLASAMAAYSVLKYYPEMIREEADCKDGTSLVIDKYVCKDGIITIWVRNNGLFKINGFKMYVSDDEKREPAEAIKLQGSENVYSDNYWFVTLDHTEGLMPLTEDKENTQEITFNLGTLSDIQLLKLQPMVLDENDYVVICSTGMIKQEITCS